MGKPADGPHPVGKGGHQNGRRKGEPEPGREGTLPPGPFPADHQADLAAGRTGQKLAQRHDIRIVGIVDPLSPGHEFILKISKMGDRAAKRSATELQEGAEDLAWASFPVLIGLSLVIRGEFLGRFQFWGPEVFYARSGN